VADLLRYLIGKKVFYKSMEILIKFLMKNHVVLARLVELETKFYMKKLKKLKKEYVLQRIWKKLKNGVK